MELMESASEVSVANIPQPKKSGSTQRLAPLSVEKEKKKMNVGQYPIINKEPASNQ